MIERTDLLGHAFWLNADAVTTAQLPFPREQRATHTVRGDHRYLATQAIDDVVRMVA